MTPMATDAGCAARVLKSAKVIAMPKSCVDDGNADLNLLFDSIGSRERMLKPGDTLFFQGDDVHAVHLLRSGWAFRYKCLEDGRRQIVDFVLPGDMVGIESSGPAPFAVETLSTCSWGMIPRAHFLAHLWRQPALGMTVVGMLAGAQLRAFDQMTSIGRQTARERVAHLLFTLAQAHEMRQPDRASSRSRCR